MKRITIALAGNPNCGKTTIFNDLTGSSQYVGNWPGVTVEKKEGKFKKDKNIVIADLPGVYSLSPYTLEEVITRNYLVKETPDVIINLVDGTNLERNLYLTTQLLELGIPVVLGVNMADLLRKNGDKIDLKKLSEQLGCPVMEVSALKGEGCNELVQCAVELAKTNQVRLHRFSKDVEEAIEAIEALIKDAVSSEHARWYAAKLFERDEEVLKELKLNEHTKIKVDDVITKLENQLDDDSESIIANERYIFIGEVVNKVLKKKQRGLTTSDKIDQIVTNRILALPIFMAIMFIVYYVSVSWLGTIVTDWTNDVLFGEYIQGGVSEFMANAGTAEWLQGLVVDGAIGGVGAVLGFVPQMFILFFFLSILEDCGYMARVAFIMDRIFRKFGLSGKSFIPLLVGSGCGVPGIMATKTIENEKDRRMTIMTTTFIPCGAKLPVIALIGGAMFPHIPWLAPAMYFAGIAAVVFSGIALKKTKMFAGDTTPFVMELPQYHMPAAKGVLIHMWERGKSFIIKAGTVIFVACAAIWFLSNFGFSSGGFGMVEQDDSMLAAIGTFAAPIFAPLGFGNWQAAVATISGLVAKENVVGTFGVLFGLGADVAEDDAGLLTDIASMFPYSAAALSFLVFNLLCAPCFAAIGAIRREMNNAKWTWFAIGYQTILAYVVALIVNQIGGVIFGGLTFGAGTVVAIVLLAIMIFLLVRPMPKKRGTMVCCQQS
ncbi:MAG: ferrous iron transport protein B [Clostridiales bacterium]|jgi:ferrous iron transport protein B|uniref:ferrous iron transport protein B n=1 Tax=Aminipila sp. TaxID=2060095 RepID=UPI001DC7BD0B|nr:ferrous iron transport protein B [Aminipila sp.]MBE6033093.1 ferrous iron transport protein B [Clostridiales bacterium]